MRNLSASVTKMSSQHVSTLYVTFILTLCLCMIEQNKHTFYWSKAAKKIYIYVVVWNNKSTTKWWLFRLIKPTIASKITFALFVFFIFFSLFLHSLFIFFLLLFSFLLTFPFHSVISFCTSIYSFIENDSVKIASWLNVNILWMIIS